jgi:hypothetical protein
MNFNLRGKFGFGKNDKLEICEGDCGNDTQCSDNLICFHRNEFEPVPGCYGQGTAAMDYCVVSPSSSPSTSASPTQPGIGLCGDCTSDFDCKDGLVCWQRDKYGYSIPGCGYMDDYGQYVSYCVEDKKKLRGYNWNPDYKLGMCEGDCDSDLDCYGNLVCFKREYYEAVPGCIGYGRESFDYCTDLNATRSPSPSPSPTYYSGNISDDWDERSIGLITVLIFAALFLFLCARSRLRRQQQQQQQQQTQPVDETGSNPQNDLTDEERKHERRMKILMNIIHKKVLPKEHANDKGGKNDEDVATLLPHEQSLSSRILVNNASLHEVDGSDTIIEDKETSVPDEESLSSRILVNNASLHEADGSDTIIEDADSFPLSSLVPIPAAPQSNKNEESTNENNNERISKDDVYVNNMRSLRKSMNIKTESISSLYSPKSCPICMEEYKVGDEICWSRNTDCYHAFHLDCILSWLMENDECPMCRGDYLCIEDQA